MTSVWYVQPVGSRVIRSADWVKAGVYDAAGDFTWGPANGYSYPTAVFSTQQLAYLDSLDTEFWVGAPDGPRKVQVSDPTGYVTEARVRELIAQAPTSGLTPASVGLDKVDNTADLYKPLSVAASQALAAKADYPSGGVDGQILAKSGSTTVWAAPGYSGGSVSVTLVDDPDAPSGQSVQVTGSGVSVVPDPAAPSGYSVSVNGN